MARPTNAAIVDLKGRKWTPFESKGVTGHVTYTDNSGEIHIPYGADPVSLMIQAHELSHVRYSSKVWRGSTEDLLKHLTSLAKTNASIVGYAEDMRITALAGRLNVKTLPSFTDKLDAPVIKGWIESFVEAGIPEERVVKAARFILNEHTTVVERLGLDLNTLQMQENAERYIVFCAQHIHNLLAKGEDKSDKSTEGKSDKKAKSDKYKKSKSDKSGKSEKPSDKDEDENSEGDESESSEGDDESDSADEGDEGGDSEGDSEGEADAKDDSSEASDSGEPGEPGGDAFGEINLSEMELPDIRQAMVNHVPAPVDTEKLIQQFQHTLDTADWIPVSNIERVPLVRRAAQARRKGRKLSETGVVLGSAYDAVSPNERRPFVAKRKGGVGGLTVVIDCSGSMHISEDQIEQLLTAHPQGVVVTYNSMLGDCYNPQSDKANVRVIASHGRLAKSSDFRNIRAGANGCDGPVLEWLAKQPGERVWICDGIITGHRDMVVVYNPDSLTAWLKAHRIVQHKSLTAYLENLKYTA
jgi:hypothetical protein